MGLGNTRLELFARQKVAGWDCWGNEVESDIELLPPNKQKEETMPYLRVVCYYCGNVWNYYDKKEENYPPTTAVPVLGGTCPKCDCLGYISQVRYGAKNPDLK